MKTTTMIAIAILMFSSLALSQTFPPPYGANQYNCQLDVDTTFDNDCWLSPWYTTFKVDADNENQAVHRWLDIGYHYYQKAKQGYNMTWYARECGIQSGGYPLYCYYEFATMGGKYHYCSYTINNLICKKIEPKR